LLPINLRVNRRKVNARLVYESVDQGSGLFGLEFRSLAAEDKTPDLASFET
jgi:hypothetical protein